MERKEIEKLKNKAKKLRRQVLNLALKKGDGHLGGSFSEIEILISLYKKVMKKEDTFILSKGHACYPLYLILQEKGYSPKVCGHPEIDQKNGISCTTGSLGHGLPIAVGMALAKKILKKNGRVYVLMGDGEIQEGTTWESSLVAVHHKLDNLIVIIDYNKLQALEPLKKVVSFKNLKSLFKEIGYKVLEIDGHSFSEIIKALNAKTSNRPLMIIANTIKGKGVSFMENNPKWHARRAVFEEVKGAFEELK